MEVCVIIPANHQKGTELYCILLDVQRRVIHLSQPQASITSWWQLMVTSTNERVPAFSILIMVIVVYCGFIRWTHRICRLNLLQPALFLALLNQKRWTLSGYLGAFLLMMVSLSFFFLFFFHVFNFTTLTDTLLDINCKNSGNQAAVLSHTIAVHSQHYWLQRIIYSALLIAEYIHYNLTVNVIYCKLYRLDDCFLLSTKKTEKE